MFTRKSATDLRGHAEALRQRAKVAEDDAATERAKAAEAFAEDREEDAKASVSRASRLAAESSALLQAADDVERKAAYAEEAQRMAEHVDKVAHADRLAKSARELIAKVGPRIVKDLRAIQEISAEAAFAVRQAEQSATNFDGDAPEPTSFDIPAAFLSGPASPRRLADAIEAWFAKS